MDNDLALLHVHAFWTSSHAVVIQVHKYGQWQARDPRSIAMSLYRASVRTNDDGDLARLLPPIVQCSSGHLLHVIQVPRCMGRRQKRGRLIPGGACVCLISCHSMELSSSHPCPNCMYT